MDTILRWAARLIGAGMLGATAGIHAQLYTKYGYRHIPGPIGALFLALAIGASVLCVAVIVAPKSVLALVAAAGAITEAATVTGVLIFTHRSLPGFHGFMDSTSAPHYQSSLTVEIIGFVVLGGLAISALGALRHRTPAR